MKDNIRIQTETALLPRQQKTTFLPPSNFSISWSLEQLKIILNLIKSSMNHNQQFQLIYTHQLSKISLGILIVFFAAYSAGYAQISPEAEPNNTVAEALASSQDRIFEPTTMTGTVSSGDDDYFLIGYDFSLNFGGETRWWVYFDGNIPAGITVERGFISSPTGIYAGTESSLIGPFTNCGTFDYTSTFIGTYAYLKISSTDGISRSYSIDIKEKDAEVTSCFGAALPEQDVIVTCTAPTATTLSGTTRTGQTTLRLNSFPTVADADGYIVQISENSTFATFSDTYDQPLSSTPTSVYSGSGNQIVAQLTSPADVDVSGLSTGTTYTFKVTPYSNCLSNYRKGIGVTSVPTPTCGVLPSAPTAMTLNSPSVDALSIQSIGASLGGAQGYIVYMSDSPVGFTAPTSIPAANAVYSGSGVQAVYVGSSLTPNEAITGTVVGGSTYYFRTYAYDICDGISYFDPTGVASSKFICEGAPPAPTVLSLTGISHSSLTVASISPVATADGYVVLMNTTNSFTTPADGTSLPTANAVYGGSGEQVVYAGTSSTTNTSVTGLDNSNGGVTYYFKAFAFQTCEGNNYFESTGIATSATTRGAAQTVASNAIFFEVGDAFMDFKSFTGAAGASGHVIKMNTSNSFTIPAGGGASLPSASTAYAGGEQVIYAGTSTLPDFRITGLTAATTYYFSISTYSDIDGLLFYNQTAFEFSQQNVKPASSITFSDITRTYGDAAFAAIASTNSTGAFTYSLVSQTNGGSVVAPSGVVTVGNVGTVTIQVDQVADANFNPGTAQTTLTINKVDPIIQFDPVIVSDGAADQILVAMAQVVGSAASASTGIISYNIEGTPPAGNSLSGTNNATWTPGQAGTFTMRASIAADANHNSGFLDALFSVSAPAANYFLTSGKLSSYVNGSEVTVIPINSTLGTNPVGFKIFNDRLWVVTRAGGTNGKGLIFDINFNGTSPGIKANFPASAATNIGVGFLHEADGKIWVIASNGGASQLGEIYSMNMDGSNFQAEYAFTGAELINPFSELVAYNGKLYGGASFDIATSSGGIYSLTPDGMGGYTYATELVIPTTNEKRPASGLTLFDDLIWYTTDISDRIVAYDPVTNSVPHSINIGGYGYKPIVVDNRLFVATDNHIYEIQQSGASYVLSTVHTFAFPYTNSGDLTYDGVQFHGIALNSSTSRGVLYKLALDGTGFDAFYNSPTETFRDRSINVVERLTPEITFTNQTVDHLSVTSLNATSNSTGAITYELISDATGSGLTGNQFTAGNAGTVTIRASLAQDVNFNAATKDVTFTIQKADPTFTIADLTLPFASATQTLAPSATNYTGGTITYQFVDGAGLATTGPNTGSTISGDQLTVSNPGTETIRVTLPDNSNFNAATVDFQLTVNNAVADLSGFVDITAEFFQADVTLSVPSASGIAVSYQLLTSNTGSSLSGSNNETLSIGNVVGTETIRVTVTEPNYQAATKDITLTVNKATPALSWATPADIQFGIESLDASRLNASANVPGTFIYWIGEADFGTEITPGTTTLGLGANQQLTASFFPTNTDNYQEATVSVNINATKINLEFTADDKVWVLGQTEPALTYTVTSGEVLSTHFLFLPLTRGVDNTIGTYSVEIDLAQTAPYLDPFGEDTPLCTPGLCIVNGSATSVIQTTFYNITFVPGTFTITDKPQISASDINFTAPASLTFDNMVKTYNFGVAILDPLLPASDIDLTYEGRNGTTYASSATAPRNGGDYIVTATVKASNLDYGGSVSENFTIAPFATTINLNLPDSNLAYNGMAQGISPTANDLISNPTVALTTEYSITGTGFFSETAPTIAGTYDVRVNIAVAETSYSAAEATGSFTIDPSPQTITFNPIPDVECGQNTIDLSLYASSSTGNTLSFASDNVAVATVAGGVATIVGAGTATITASQAGDANTVAALDQTQSLTIAAVQENFSVDNPADVLVCNGMSYLLPALTTGNYFSASGGTGTAYSTGDPISSTTTLYIYGVSGVNATCTDENSFTITIDNLPVDNLSNVTTVGSYILPALTNGNYFTGTGGTGSALNAGDPVSSTQTIYIYNVDVGLGCSAESSFVVTIEVAPALHFQQVVNFTDYDYLSVADDNSLDFTTHFTYEAWVNFDQLSETNAGFGWRSLFQKSRYTDSYGLMVLASTKLMRFYHTGVGGGFTDYNWSSLSPGAWHHVAVKWDGTNSKTSILIDGVEVASNTSVTGSLPVNALPLLIGASDDRASDPYPFDGAMDEIRFWNIARTDTEINDNKDAELAGTEPGLVLYYNFSGGVINGDNTSLTQVIDRSTAGNNGTFNTFALSGTTSNFVDGSGNGVVSSLPQSITFGPLSNVTFGDADFNLTASASSGLGVSYVSSNTAVATVSGNTVTIVGAGTTTITASQSGNASYLAASNVDQTLTVDPFNTSIALNLPGTNPTYTGVGQGVTPTANDVSSNPTLAIVTEYSVQGANSFSAAFPVDAGIYDVRANLNVSETNYAASEATSIFTIDKALLTATLDDVSVVYGEAGANNHPTTYTGFVNGETESVLSIAPDWPQATYLNGSSFYSVGGSYMGAVIWEANPELQVTSTNYAIIFETGNITSVTARPINITANNRTITYGADANTGHMVSFEANDNVINRGLASGETAADFTGAATFSNITDVNVGTYNGTITPDGGLSNSNYNITYVSGNLTINQADLTVKAQGITRAYAATNPTVVTFEYAGFQNGDGTNGDTDISGLTGFAGSAAGTIAASADAMAAVGSTHAITVNAAGLSSSNYNFVADNTGILTIIKANQSITFEPLADNAVGDADFTLGATASSGLTVTYSSSDVSVATVSGNTVTIVGVGTTNITAAQVGNANYNAAMDVVQSLTVNQASQTITFGALADVMFGDADLTLTGTASSGLDVTYASSDPAVATVSGNTVTITGVGTTNVTASQAGDASFSAALDVVQSLTVTHGNYERYFVKVNSIYGMTAANAPVLVKTLNTAEGQDVEALLKVGNQIWGTANLGGANSMGTLFRMDPDGGNFEVLHDFTVAEGNPRNDMAVVGDATVYGIAGDYGVFSISVTNPAAGPTFYNGYSGSNQFTVGLTYNRGNLWTIDNNASMVGVKPDLSSHELVNSFTRVGGGDVPGVPVTDLLAEGYWMQERFKPVDDIFWLYSVKTFDPVSDWEWRDINASIVELATVPTEDENQSKMVVDKGLYFTTGQLGGNVSLWAGRQTQLNASNALNNFRSRDIVAAFNANIGASAYSALAKPYVNFYDVQDSVIWGLRGDAATGLYEAFSYHFVDRVYEVHDFGSGNLQAGVPNTAFFNFRKTATLVTHDQTKSYGDANPAFTYDIWGLDAGDDATTIGGVTISTEVIFAATAQPTTVVDVNTHPGNYPIMAFADTLNGKYDLRHQYGALTITHAIQQSDLTFSPATATYTYDGTAKAFTAVGKAGTPAGSSGIFADVSGSSLSSATDFDYTYAASTDGGMTYTVDLGTTAPMNAGFYIAIATVKSGNPIYSGSATFDFEIEAMGILINPNTVSKTYDAMGTATDPEIGFTHLPALLGADVFTGALSRTEGSDAGDYPVDLGTLSAGSNYELFPFPQGYGDFTITPLDVTVTPDPNQTRVYDGNGTSTDPTLTYTGSLLSSDAFSGALTRATGTDVNTYTIELGTLNAGGNYNLSVAAEIFEITPLSITVTPDPDQSKVYDAVGIATDPTLTYAHAPALLGSDVFTGALTRASGSDVNTYAIEMGTLASGSNYSVFMDAETFEITQRNTFVTVHNQTKMYGDADPVLTYELAPGSLLVGSDTFTGALARDGGEVVDMYAITEGTLTAGSNYHLNFLPANLTIDPRDITVTADDKTKIQGASDPTLTYTLSGTLVNGDMLTGALTRVAGETLGDYVIQQGTLTAGGNYNINFMEGTLTITDKLLQSITFNALEDVTYGGAAFTVSAVGGASGNPVTFSSSNPAIATVSENTVTIVGAGTTNIVASQLGDANYADAADVIQSLTVNVLNIEITADAANKIYGAIDPIFTYQLTNGGLVGADVITGSLDRISGEFVGTYAIIQGSVDAGSNYAINFVSDDLTIGTRSIEVTADAVSKIYGDTDPSLTYQLTNGSLIGADVIVGSLTRITGEHVGTYTVNQGSIDAGSNYAINFVSDDLTINQRPIELTADPVSKVYGDADPTFTYQLTNGTLTFGDVLSGSLGRAVGEDVGLYALTQGSVTAGTNYAETFVSDNLTVNKADLDISAQNATSTYGSNPSVSTNLIYSGFVNGDDESVLDVLPLVSTVATATSPVGSYTATLSGGSDNNYNYVLQDGTLNVVAKGLVITAINRTIMYGEDVNTGNSVNYDGFVNGETESVLTGSLSFGNIVQTNVGFYAGAIIPSGLSETNYDITYVNGDLTISPRALTVAADAKSKTYGDADPIFTYQLTSGGLVNGDEFTGTLSIVEGENAGSYGLTQGTLTAGSNYTITYVSADLVIGKADLSISVENTTSEYGNDPTVNTDFTYSGFVNDDDIQVLDELPIVSTIATATSPVGSYVATLSGGSDNNYNYNLQDGTVEVTSVPLVITAENKSSIYGDMSLPELTVLYSGFVNGEDELILLTSATVSVTATTGTDVGDYLITASGATATNYSISYVAGTLAIGQAQLIATADDQEVDAGQSLPVFSITYSGFVNGEDESVIDVAPTASVSIDNSLVSGEYEIGLSGGSDNNYIINLVTGTLNVNQVLGILEEQEIKVYPNPVVDELIISSDKVSSIEIYDFRGVIMYSSPVYGRVNLSDLAIGPYVLHLKDINNHIIHTTTVLKR